MKQLRFETFMEEILEIERGYSDRKNDRGGKTNYGITEKTARSFGYTGEMKDLSKLQALDIYYWGYWKIPKINYLADDKIAFECLDNAINMGQVRSIKLLQKAFNIVNYKGTFGDDLKVDGCLGYKTLEQVNQHLDPVRLLKLINAFQAKYYLEIAIKDKSQRSNIWGWIKQRVRI